MRVCLAAWNKPCITHDRQRRVEIDARGIARVRSTRISLELLVEAFSDGASAEEIVLR